jgi:hypothetical protein
MDENSDGNISKDEFSKYMLNYQKRQLCELDGEMEDIRTMFREVACGEVNSKFGTMTEQIAV